MALASTECIFGELWEGDTYSHTNGRPDCPVSGYDIKWRNNFDSKSYWVCQDSEAILYQCEDEHLFDYLTQTCIHYKNWEWTAPFDPPAFDY